MASLLILGSFILGATTLQEFALALLIGLFAGAYSSIFIASPLLAVLKEREPRYRDIRRRLEGKATGAEPVAGRRRRATGDDDAADAGGATRRRCRAVRSRRARGRRARSARSPSP